jgi:hypothetical protein
MMNNDFRLDDSFSHALAETIYRALSLELRQQMTANDYPASLASEVWRATKPGFISELRRNFLDALDELESGEFPEF